MNVSEVETRELLAAVRKASEQARSTHETMTAAAAARERRPPRFRIRALGRGGYGSVSPHHSSMRPISS